MSVSNNGDFVIRINLVDHTYVTCPPSDAVAMQQSILSSAKSVNDKVKEESKILLAKKKALDEAEKQLKDLDEAVALKKKASDDAHQKLVDFREQRAKLVQTDAIVTKNLETLGDEHASISELLRDVPYATVDETLLCSLQELTDKVSKYLQTKSEKKREMEEFRTHRDEFNKWWQLESCSEIEKEKQLQNQCDACKAELDEMNAGVAEKRLKANDHLAACQKQYDDHLAVVRATVSRLNQVSSDAYCKHLSEKEQFENANDNAETAYRNALAEMEKAKQSVEMCKQQKQELDAKLAKNKDKIQVCLRLAMTSTPQAILEAEQDECKPN